MSWQSPDLDLLHMKMGHPVTVSWGYTFEGLDSPFGSASNSSRREWGHRHIM